ncbi:MAG TPA: pyridoxal phosphate-dependent aminotransferase [Verrucomicrobiales bacterium]|nr:pyridoxal phosphate-dependent aminotransferase [Verrucomicrobiales bacterium]
MGSFVAAHIEELSPSRTLAITSQAKALMEEGKDICSFGAGEPDLDTPAHIVEAAVEALRNGFTKYTPSSGIPQLREAIAEKLFVDNNIEYSPAQVSVNCGAKHSCFNAILAACDPGDEVIIPTPYWTSYPEMVRIAGAKPVFVETHQDQGWKLTSEAFENAMSPRTKMVILNSPGNPTGAVYSEDELRALAEVAVSEDILILSDEIYEKLVYGKARHVSIASLDEDVSKLTITIGGFSKAYSMTGWRLGYTAAPPDLAKAIDNIQSHTTSNPTSFAQYGGLAAIHGDQQIVQDMREEYDIRRRYMLSRLETISNISTVEPLGAFYFLVNIASTGLNSINLAEKLLSRYEVAVVPGIAFGKDDAIRFSYATGLDVIKKGMDRFNDFCRSH